MLQKDGSPIPPRQPLPTCLPFLLVFTSFLIHGKGPHHQKGRIQNVSASVFGKSFVLKWSLLTEDLRYDKTNG